MPTRSELRQHFRNLRRQISAKACSDAELALLEQLRNSEWLPQHTHIACYLNHDGEMGTLPLINYLWAQQKICYLPVVAKNEDRFMMFVSYHPGDELQLNRYNIYEPLLINHRIQSPENLDLIFVPLVAFDAQGHRLGMGGGYYDRTFAFLTENTQGKKPLLIGVGYEAQKIDSLEAASWDIKLDGVITEKNCYWFGEAGK